MRGLNSNFSSLAVGAIFAVAFFFLLSPGVVLADAASDLQQQVLGTTPRLQVPIPGVDITKAVRTNDGITIPYLAQYIRGVYGFLISIVGVLAGVMIMVGGFQYLTAGGDKGRVDAGKEKITNAVAGLILALSSFIILTTINPKLTEFQYLSIPTVAQAPLPEFGGKDDPVPANSPGAKQLSDPAYDAIFQKYAPCAGADWRVLKAIAYKESGLNPEKVNASGYIGLFQTKPENCSSALSGYVLASQCNDLKNPDVNTAVGAMMLRGALRTVSARCAEVSAFEKAVMFYINHNMGPAVLKHAVGFGCDLPSLRNGSIDYYVKHPESIKGYPQKYQPQCLAQGKSEAECMGGPKFDFAKQTASAITSMGINSLEPPTGSCPLVTNYQENAIQNCIKC